MKREIAVLNSAVTRRSARMFRLRQGVTLALVLGCVLACTPWAHAAIIGPVAAQGEPGCPASVPIVLDLGGDQADRMAFSLEVTPNDEAPGLMADLDFEATEPPPPGIVDAAPGWLAVGWLSTISPALSGTVALGNVLLTVPEVAQPGDTYTVHMVSVGCSLGSNEIPTTPGPDVVVTVGESLAAEFSGDPLEGCAPLTVSFHDESAGSPTSWLWDFGDGGTSEDRNPTHMYEAIDTYTVCLTVWNEFAEDTECKSGYIDVPSIAPEANFSADVTAGCAPLTVCFHDESTGAPTSWYWEFGDGSVSESPEPCHTYEDEDSYSVCLTVSNTCGNDTECKPDYICVTGTAPIADFGGTPVAGWAPLEVDFSDLSTGEPTSWLWDFGDGGTSEEQNPTHTYENAGYYDVSLTVSNGCGSHSTTNTEYICVEFGDVPDTHWAFTEIMACVQAGIVQGYEDNLYHPDDSVTRDQMAVYIARALAGGDQHVPPGPADPTFPDVQPDHWAYRYVEYIVSACVTEGYPDHLYHPDGAVARDQMAVYIARALVGCEGEIPPGPPEPTFPDVQPDHWAYDEIEYCAENGVVQGYEDGWYHPEIVVKRDQMAVYIARAFSLVE